MSGKLDGKEVLTWQQLLDEGARLLAEAGIAEAGLDAWYLLEKAFQTDRVHFFLDQNRNVFGSRLEKGLPVYREYLRLRTARIPLQQILCEQDFMGLTFLVNEYVLIPRQDTEKLVEEVLKEHPKRDEAVLDMCTGSGCIAISLAVLGGYDRVTAVDKSQEALKVAKKNGSSLFMVQEGNIKAKSELISKEPWQLRFTVRRARRPAAPDEGSEKGGDKNGKSWPEAREQMLTFIEGDMFENLEQAEKYSIIVSNPPYIPSAVIEGLEPEVRDYEPRMALDGAEDGLYFYRILADRSKEYLIKGGSVYFEIGYDQAAAVTELLLEKGYGNIRVTKDETGLDRIVSAVWQN